MKRPVDSAQSVLLSIVDELTSGSGVPNFQDAMDAIASFARVQFDVPNESDSDGFLFQYGEVNWYSEPVFAVGFVRQMEIVDAGGEHEGYSQVQLEYQYSVDASLSSLASHSSWCFYEDEARFGEWLGLVKRDSVWNAIREKKLVNFCISQESV
ncbi:hypothetical protein GCM10023347_25820 [Streptomyces chumphonensis]